MVVSYAYFTVAVSKLAQFSKAPADFTLVEMTARGGEGTSVSRRSEPPLDVICADIDSGVDVAVLGCHESPCKLLESLLPLTSPLSVI